MRTFPDASVSLSLSLSADWTCVIIRISRSNTTTTRIQLKRLHRDDEKRVAAYKRKVTVAARGRIKRRRTYIYIYIRGRVCIYIIVVHCTFSGTEITSRSARGRPPVFFALFVSDLACITLPPLSAPLSIRGPSLFSRFARTDVSCGEQDLHRELLLLLLLLPCFFPATAYLSLSLSLFGLSVGSFRFFFLGGEPCVKVGSSLHTGRF